MYLNYHTSILLFWSKLTTRSPFYSLHFLQFCAFWRNVEWDVSIFFNRWMTKSRRWVEVCFQVCIADLEFHVVCFCLQVPSSLSSQELDCLNMKTASEQNWPEKKRIEISSELLLLYWDISCPALSRHDH